MCQIVTIRFGFTFDWMKKWCMFLSQSRSVVDVKPIPFQGRYSTDYLGTKTKVFTVPGTNNADKTVNQSKIKANTSV